MLGARLSGIVWQVLSGRNETLAPGPSRRLAIAREGRTWLPSMVKPEFKADRHARLVCHDGVWSGGADDGIVRGFIHFRGPGTHAIRRAAWTQRRVVPSSAALDDSYRFSH